MIRRSSPKNVRAATASRPPAHFFLVTLLFLYHPYLTIHSAIRKIFLIYKVCNFDLGAPPYNNLLCAVYCKHEVALGATQAPFKFAQFLLTDYSRRLVFILLINTSIM
jgi:hypothetical protein